MSMGYHVRVKICGVTSPEDAFVAADAGADAVGLNFYPKSPRYIADPLANAVLDALPPFVEPVGVFAGERPASILEQLVRLKRVRIVQSHGDLPEPAQFAPHPLILAVQVSDEGSLAKLTDYLTFCRGTKQLPAALLVDARVPGLYGGTGRKAPWDLLAGFRPGIPMILAGGLTPENVAEAIRVVRPFAVDVASGVESSPARKDPARVRQFIRNAREAARKLPD